MKKLYKYLFLLIFLYSCNATKYVPENQELLTKNTIIVDKSSKNTKELNQYLVQRPNYKTLGLPLSLYFYNLGNPRGVEKISQWQKKYPKTYNTFSKIFSPKQANATAKSFINFNKWFLENGESPRIIDDQKTIKSKKNLKIHFQNQGYFNSKITSKRRRISNKKGKITYYITKGEPLMIDSVSVSIKSPVLDSLYQINKEKTLLKSPQQYNNENFVKEANRLTKLFRNEGVFHFNKDAILFNIDTLSGNNKAKIYTEINDRVIEKEGGYVTKPYQIQRIKKVNIYTDYNYNQKNNTPKISELHNGINFFAFEKLRYKPKYLAQSIFIKPNQIYSDDLRSLTRSHLRKLENFKSTIISYKELNDNELEANIYLTPSDRYAFNVKTEFSRSNIRIYDIGAKFSFINKNTFKGAEFFKLSGYGSYFKTENENDLGWEIGADVSLEIPRFIAPFGLKKLVPKKMFPKTRFMAGIGIQKNIGLDRKIFNLGVDYKWNLSPKKKVQFELLNTQYVRNFNVFQYFEIYRSELNKITDVAKIKNYPISNLNNYQNAVNFMNDTARDYNFSQSNPSEYNSLLNVLNRHNIITSDFLIPVTSYSFTYNSQESFRDKNFSYFKIRFANSGNFLGYMIDQKDIRDKQTLFNIPIAQYFKTDIEYKKFWEVSRTSVFGVRFFGGVIIPYNKSDIPFSKSYFAGGSNDIRAWKTYDLGPGSRPQGLEYNVGNLKLLANLEYRFDMIGSFKGALFVDAGNIWNIREKSFVDDTSKLNKFNSLLNIAIGSGVGLRYDFKFLVARIDLGFKVREPYLKENQWFSNFSLNKAVYNFGINYPF